MRGVVVALGLLMMTVSGCLGDEPQTADVDDGAGSGCTVSGNATAASATCTSSGNSTTTTPAGNGTGNATGATGNATGNQTVAGNATGNATGNQTASGEVVQTLSCWVMQGVPMAAGGARLGGNGGLPGFGGCLTGALGQDSILVAVSFGAECMTDPGSAIGDAFGEGDSFDIYCDESVTDTDVSMDFAAAPA